MILTLVVLGAVLSNHRSGAEVSQCHVDLENSDVDLNEFYPSLDEPIKLPLLRYSYDWRGNGLEDSCAVVLENCEICDCKDNETALLVQARDWNVTCKILPKAALAVDRRNIGDNDDSKAVETSPIQPDKSELAGPLPSSSPDGAYSALRAQENAAPVANAPSNDASNTDGDAKDDSNDGDESNDESGAGDSADEDSEDNSKPAKKVKGETDAEHLLKALHVYSHLKHMVGEDGNIARSLGSKPSDREDPEVTTMKDDAEDDKDEVDKDDSTDDSVGNDAPTTTASAAKELKKTTEKGVSDRRGDMNEDSLPELSPKSEMKEDGLETTKFLGQVDSWRSKYFTVLGFFICFLIVFVIIVLVLVIKLKAARSEGMLSMGNVSPGPGTDRGFHAETDPLTPAGNAGSFKFNASHQSLPR